MSSGVVRWRLSDESSGQSVTVIPQLQANSGEALRQAALAGAGIVLQPIVLLDTDLKSKKLVRVLPNWEPPARKVQLLYQRDRQTLPKLRGFVDFVVDRFGAANGDSSA